MENTARVVLVTASDAAMADEIARALVQARLAACVNVLPGVTSHYIWEGKLQRDAELLLIVKTRAGVMEELIRFVRSRHSAQVPEIIALPVLDGDKPYLAWIEESTRAR